MALVLADEVTAEAQRILAATSAFDVLDVPNDCANDAVISQYTAKCALFKRHFRNKVAAMAKSRLDEAKMRLLDHRLREKEARKVEEMLRNTAATREEMMHLEERTKLLEMRAAAITQLREQAETAGKEPPS